MKLYKSLVRPHLDYCIPVWKPYLKKDMKLLEDVQRRMTKLVPSLRCTSYEERLEELKLMTIEKRHLRQDLITMFNIINGKIKLNVEDSIEFIGDTNTRGYTVARE